MRVDELIRELSHCEPGADVFLAVEFTLGAHHNGYGATVALHAGGLSVDDDGDVVLFVDSRPDVGAAALA